MNNETCVKFNEFQEEITNSITTFAKNLGVKSVSITIKHTIDEVSNGKICGIDNLKYTIEFTLE